MNETIEQVQDIDTQLADYLKSIGVEVSHHCIEQSFTTKEVLDDYQHPMEDGVAMRYRMTICRGTLHESFPYFEGVGLLGLIPPDISRRLCAGRGVTIYGSLFFEALARTINTGIRHKVSLDSVVPEARIIGGARMNVFQKPSVTSFVSRLVKDSSVMTMTLDDWCSEFGFDSDSIRVSKIYDDCVNQTRQLLRIVTPAELDTMREILEEY